MKTSQQKTFLKNTRFLLTYVLNVRYYNKRRQKRIKKQQKLNKKSFLKNFLTSRLNGDKLEKSQKTTTQK